jgi:4-hydroxy-3-polyprenylbenzoate decarboxylase
MCIDGTKKFEEEVDDNWQAAGNSLQSTVNSQQSITESLQSKFSEIKGVNVSLLKKDIPCLIISVKKNRKGHVKELHEQICALKEIEGIKMILYVEHTVDANDLPIALWRLCNNMDPKRDYHLCKRTVSTTEVISTGEAVRTSEAKYFACIGFDGTRKTKEFDDFHRDWPNIIIADDKTIKAVDTKWNQLGIGTFISSPSLKFKDQMYGEEAVVAPLSPKGELK